LLLLLTAVAGEAWTSAFLLQPGNSGVSHARLVQAPRQQSHLIIRAAPKTFVEDDVAWLSPQELVVSTQQQHHDDPHTTINAISPPRPSLRPNEAHALACLDACPLVAVLRGVAAADLPKVVMTLRQEGLTMISIPAESPAGMEGLRALTSSSLPPSSSSSPTQNLSPFALGAATVISPEQVDLAAAAGASFISCPHTDPAILERAKAHGLLVLPGILTPSEAFLALKHGAHVLKLFPSQAVPPSMVASIAAVLPPPARLFVSGGVQAEDMPAYLAAGAVGFALGSTLFKPGLKEGELAERARVFVTALRAGQKVKEEKVKEEKKKKEKEERRQ
jgi:2-dehydro-3-deoxyphosphogalactonate aldolase